MKALLRLGILAAAVVMAAVGLALRDASASGAAGATIDRTLACTVLPAGTGAVTPGATSRTGSAVVTPASASISTGNGGSEMLLEATTGRGGFYWPVGNLTLPAGAVALPGLTINASLCHPANGVRVPLTARGLSGGPATLGAHVTCLTARQVFIHLRVVMASESKWMSKPPYQLAHGKPLSAQIAIRSRKQKPLVYMTIKGDTARFYSAASCF